MYKILSEKSSCAVIMHNSIYLTLEDYFSLIVNVRFFGVKFKPFGDLFLYGSEVV